jgi:hypothetical protein
MMQALNVDAADKISSLEGVYSITGVNYQYNNKRIAVFDFPTYPHISGLSDLNNASSIN